MKILVSLSTAKASPISQFSRTVRNSVRLNWSKRRAEYKKYPVDRDTGLRISFNEWLDSKTARWKITEIQPDNGKPQVVSIVVDSHDVMDLLGVDLHDGLDIDELKLLAAKHFKTLAAPQGWYVPEVRNSRSYISIFFRPLAYSPIIRLPKFLYHFSALSNKGQILRKGLLPRRGQYGTDFMYPPRVHLLSKYDLGSINELATSIFSHGSGQSIESQYHDGVDGADMPIVVFKIDTARLLRGTKVYRDPSVENGVWTYTHIPPATLSVVYEDPP